MGNESLDIKAFGFIQQVERSIQISRRLFQSSLGNTSTVGPVNTHVQTAQFQALLKVLVGSFIISHLVVQHRHPQIMMRRNPQNIRIHVLKQVLRIADRSLTLRGDVPVPSGYLPFLP